MGSQKQNNIPKFLQNGSEMAQLIAGKDWKEHALGEPENWPMALKLTLNTMLNTAFPKFLLWGEKYYNFYNDAYRPSLGTHGKHPYIIGKGFDEAWPELKETMKPQIDVVFSTGKPTWHENQLIPIYRNGKIEEVYWTLSYSAIFGDTMEISGVLVTCIETTDAVKNVKRLEESEDELKFAINAADLGTWDYNPLTDQLKTNHRLKGWFGLPITDEIKLEQATNAIIAKDRERVNRTIQNALSWESGGKYDITYTIQNKETKQKRIVRALGRAWFNENRKAYRFNGTLQDITEQQKVVNHLKLNEERFRRLVKEVPVGIAIISAEDYTIKVVNEMALMIWQKTLDESLNMPLFDVLTEIKDSISPIFESILRTKKAKKGMEYPFVLERNGVKETGYFNFIFKPILENNQVIEIMLVAFEMTETVKAKFKLEESERQFKNFVMQSPIAMGVLRGEAMKIEMANNSLLNQFWRKKKEEVLGKGLLEIFPNLSDSKYPEIIQSIIKTGIPVSEKESYAALQDENGIWEFYVDYIYAPLRDVDGNVSGVMVTTTDVTDRVKAREKLEKFSKDLEKQVALRTTQLKVANNKLQVSIQNLENRNEELEAFAYVSSHDLQEPLRKIQMFISRILEREQDTLTDKGKTYFDKITDSATRMRILIDDLLTFSRSNKKDAEFEETDLNLIVKEVIDNLSEGIENSRAQITCTSLPTITAIPFQLHQVFTNLIGNAIKFSRKNTIPKIHITAEAATSKEITFHKLQKNTKFYKIAISDNGIGFPKEMAYKIFEVFQRVHSQQEYKGTGIGLAIVKKIVLNHDGVIVAESKEGEGTTISMFIPKNRL